MRHRLYLTPGMFGFGKLATYDYFAHVTLAMKERFAAAGAELDTHVVDVAPTASIRRRATRLAELVAATSGSEREPEREPIHILGHSTGGLDARLVASPSARLPIAGEKLSWMPRLRSVTTMSTPHYGTPLASFFATVSGQRLLYAVSALTFVALSVGAPPLAAASALVAVIGQLDRAVLGMELKVLDRTTDALLKALEPAQSREVRDFLDAISKDQGAMVQLMPEAMDLFLSGIEDRPGVLYQCTVAAAPPPSARRLARAMLSPWRALSSTLFTTLYGITGRLDENYPCAPPDADALLRPLFPELPTPRANDGVVPTRSQLWGNVIWSGAADHLDVLGHFTGAVPVETVREPIWRRVFAKRPDAVHVDWLTSGANFDEVQFARLMDAAAKGMLDSAKN